jgi:hypothetical protein
MFDQVSNQTTHALLLFAAAASELVVMDMQQFKCAAEDGAISQEQLVTLTEWDEHSIESVTTRLPDAVNKQSLETGDTVLHTCVRMMPSKLPKWLKGGTVFTPIPNFAGQSALHEAVFNHSRRCVTALLKSMIPTLNDVSSPLVTEALRHISKHMPELSLEVLQLLETHSQASTPHIHPNSPTHTYTTATTGI